MASNPVSEGFKKIVLNARNTSPDNEEMVASESGSIDLVVKYRVARVDPFVQTEGVDILVSEFRYSVGREKNKRKTLPRDTPVRLEFDLNPAIPLWATDVTVTLVFRGSLGAEKDVAVVAATKDISEPTPIQILNNMDKLCLGDGPADNNIYDAGATGYPLDWADTDNNGVIGPDEQDIFAHDLFSFYGSFMATGAVEPDPYFTHYDLAFSGMAAGEWQTAAYVLTEPDYQAAQSATQLVLGPVNIIKTDDLDNQHVAGYYGKLVHHIWGVVNQVYPTDDQAYCQAAHGQDAPCLLPRYRRGFIRIREMDTWSAMIYPAYIFNNSWTWGTRGYTTGFCYYDDI